MEARLDAAKLAPEPQHAMFALGKYLAKCGLEASLLELVKNAGLANQRLRLLPRYAHERRSCRR